MWAAESSGDMYTWQHSAMGKLMVCSTWKKSSLKIEKQRGKRSGDRWLMMPRRKKKQGEWGSSPMLTCGEKRREGRRGGGSGGSAAARLHRKWATIEEGTHWGGARNGVLHVGRAWHPAAGPLWAGPEEQ
jgi:hypothetical protein